MSSCFLNSDTGTYIRVSDFYFKTKIAIPPDFSPFLAKTFRSSELLTRHARTSLSRPNFKYMLPLLSDKPRDIKAYKRLTEIKLYKRFIFNWIPFFIAPINRAGQTRKLKFVTVKFIMDTRITKQVEATNFVHFVQQFMIMKLHLAKHVVVSKHFLYDIMQYSVRGYIS